MSAARKLAAVPAAPPVRLRRVTVKDALRVHPHAPNARAWLRAVTYLRTRTRCGWALDHYTTKREAK